MRVYQKKWCDKIQESKDLDQLKKVCDEISEDDTGGTDLLAQLLAIAVLRLTGRKKDVEIPDIE
jgi:hypothetical protein